MINNNILNSEDNFFIRELEKQRDNIIETINSKCLNHWFFKHIDKRLSEFYLPDGQATGYVAQDWMAFIDRYRDETDNQ